MVAYVYAPDAVTVTVPNDVISDDLIAISVTLIVIANDATIVTVF